MFFEGSCLASPFEFTPGTSDEYLPKSAPWTPSSREQSFDAGIPHRRTKSDAAMGVLPKSWMGPGPMIGWPKTVGSRVRASLLAR